MTATISPGRWPTITELVALAFALAGSWFLYRGTRSGVAARSRISDFCHVLMAAGMVWMVLTMPAHTMHH